MTVNECGVIRYHYFATLDELQAVDIERQPKLYGSILNLEFV
jgi:hypothetical protein